MSASSSSLSRAGLAGEIRTTLVLAAPLVAGHVSTGLIGFVDNTLAGHHSTTTLASVTIGTALWWLPMMVPIGTLLSVPPSVSQLEGAGRRGEIGALFRQALWMAVLLSVFLFAFLTFIPHALAAMGIAAEIIPGARDFLHGIRWGVPALTLFFCMRYLSEGLHWTLPTMLLSAGGLLVLLPLGYVLTFGKFGLPEMGAGGLGIASAVMLWVQAIGFFLVLRSARRFADLRLFERFDKPHWPTIRGLLATGLPIGVTVLMEGSLFIVTALLIGRLGEVPASAHQIAINLSALCFMVPMGLAEATTVRVGHALGRRDYAGVRYAGLAGYAIVIGTQLVSGILLLTANDLLVSFYTADAAVATLAASLLLYSAMFQFPDGIQVLSAGALRGLKDTRVPMVLAALAYWGVGMPVGAFLGLGLNWGPKGMWIGLIAGLTVASVLLCARFIRSSQPDRLAARMASEYPHEVDPHETGCT
ncbi:MULTISPECIES: MATE family efflux transporter [unclassified Lysobacter]|uniref:MATE family efflux transporter n=1 Tax=unclassified Lysobacter TaxID=2635362 RepID=UPI001BE79EDF|nr:MULTISPECIES: MATE family efflux transporter [unclassified Lysobacter]MBT2749424.1 MATE family efflux transporter [Lysobacter sp. ISL-42]MBT2750801.1 MATE family efflux transporter [Lysobacter sp. ISL-50]MBT2776052.1 MATE family efflux transporter [Lysobacter sp. ISL-54]MBT2784345.1 MATE family efflux transporter [Lysobacter sp. ISL-52]